MKCSTIQSALIATALLLCAGLSLADTGKSAAVGETKAMSEPKPAAIRAKAAKPTKLVDINSASKKELIALPGISEADADKIIAGRPYLTKAHLATKNIITRGAYEGIRMRVIAKQNKATAAKLNAMEKKGH